MEPAGERFGDARLLAAIGRGRSEPLQAGVLLTLGALAAFAGCESKGPAEKAGESIDKGVQNAKDVVNPPGAGEKAGREVDKALKP
jgi:hypothetical protein